LEVRPVAEWKANVVRFDLTPEVIGGSLHMVLTQTFGDVTTELERWVANARDESVRKYLIALGWTPPKEEIKAK
jgi:hypothetical protein